MLVRGSLHHFNTINDLRVKGCWPGCIPGGIAAAAMFPRRHPRRGSEDLITQATFVSYAETWTDPRDKPWDDVWGDVGDRQRACSMKEPLT